VLLAQPWGEKSLPFDCHVAGFVTEAKQRAHADLAGRRPALRGAQLGQATQTIGLGW